MAKQVNCSYASFPEFVSIYDFTDFIVNLGRNDYRIHIIYHFVAVGIYARIFAIPQNIINSIARKRSAFIKNTFLGQRLDNVFHKNTARI